MQKNVLSAPLVHGLQVLLIAVYDDMRSLLLMFEFIIGEHAGKLEDAMLVWIETAHL
jgi:hypothetical protein